MTHAQSTAIEQFLPIYGLPYQEHSVDLQAVYGRDAPVWMEIGFGNGDSLLHMATVYPEVNFIGVEVHAPGVGRALMGIHAQQLCNVRLIQHDAIEVLQHMLAPGALARALLLFPDPWHKKRHHKRRIMQNNFVNLLAARLSAGGLLHCATDWAEYAEWMLELLNNNDQFCSESPTRRFVDRPAWRMTTRFERRGKRLGHGVHDLLYSRC
jgi:tRNA (guanine-N7-)-methyltransferase